MPDHTKKTLSATQSAALFGASPYYTEWMLWQHFAKGVPIDTAEDGRMSWGKKLQPLVLAQAAEELRLEVVPNEGDTYHRRGLIGCTRDGQIVCPDRGRGAIETKCVFDYRMWMVEWQGGRAPPRRHEIQLQTQMAVGDENGPYKWGTLVAWIAGEQHYFERELIPEFVTELETRAAAFFAAVESMKEPDPFGAPVEAALLTKLFPVQKGKVLDLQGDPTAEGHAEAIAMYAYHKSEEGSAKRAAEPLRTQILALARDAEEILLPFGVKVKITPSGTGKRITTYIPDGGAPSPSTAPAKQSWENIYAG